MEGNISQIPLTQQTSVQPKTYTPFVNPQLIFSWKAPMRPYKKRSSTIIRFYLAVTLLLSLIVFFLGDIVLLIPIWALLFLFYVLTVTPPPEIENKITRFGIETANMSIRWEFLSHFYFTKRFGFHVLTLVSHPPYFYHVFLVVPNEEIKKKLIIIFSEHLMFTESPRKGIIEKIIDWLSSLVPNEEEKVKTVPATASTTVKQASL